MQENWMKDRGEIILQSDNGEHGGTVVHKQLRGSFRCHKKWIVYAGGQRDFPFNCGTNEMNTRRLYQIQRSVLHTGTSLAVSKDCRIYPGARCLTVRDSVWSSTEDDIRSIFISFDPQKFIWTISHVGIQTEDILRTIRQQSTLAFQHGSIVFLSICSLTYLFYTMCYCPRQENPWHHLESSQNNRRGNNAWKIFCN